MTRTVNKVASVVLALLGQASIVSAAYLTTLDAALFVGGVMLIIDALLLRCTIEYGGEG